MFDADRKNVFSLATAGKGARTPAALLCRQQINNRLKKGEVHVVHSGNIDRMEPAFVRWLRRSRIDACATIPMLNNSELIGCLFVGCAASDLTPIVMEVLREVVDQLASALSEAQLKQEVIAARTQLENLSRQLLEAQESERRVIARELHDEVGQALTALKILLQGKKSVNALPQELREALSIVDRLLTQVRDLSLNLRPSLLDDLGLIAALRWYLDRQAIRTGLTIHFNPPPDEVSIPAGVATTCFRIVQEAVTNVIRHARANRIQVWMRATSRHIRLSVSDDGIGFDSEAAFNRAQQGESIGIIGMRERAQLAGGKLDIVSLPERGTTVKLSIRFNEKDVSQNLEV